MPYQPERLAPPEHVVAEAEVLKQATPSSSMMPTDNSRAICLNTGISYDVGSSLYFLILLS
jgi:hypothetical protein